MKGCEKMDSQSVNVINSHNEEENSINSHKDGEHHHHHSDRGHHHHHHHHSGTHHKSNNNNNQPEKIRLLKRGLILLLIIVLFFSCYYVLIIERLDNNRIENSGLPLSETEVLKNQLKEAQDEITALKEELSAYKDAFGELDSDTEK